MGERMFVDVVAELLGRGHSVRFRAYGRSMHPTIRDGEEIVVEPLAASAVRVGDVALYRSQRGVVAHRVVRIARTERRRLSDEQKHRRAGHSVLIPRYSLLIPQHSVLSPHYSFILRGDASDSCDAPVEAEQVLGKVVSVERDGHNIDLDGYLAKCVSAVRLCAARFRRAIRSRLSVVAHLLQLGSILPSGRR